MHHLFAGFEHMIIAAAAFLLHSIWLIATPLLAYKRYRPLWLLEGFLLAFFCGILGFLVELLLTTDRSAGRTRKLAEMFPSAP